MMSATTSSGRKLMSGSTVIKGMIRKVIHGYDGLTEIHLDNGAARKITFVCHTEDAHVLLAEDTHALRDHLMTFRPGRFRKRR